jgi:uncharacterized protein YxjI
MSTRDVVSGVDLSGRHYVARQALVRNKYEVTNDRGEVVLRAKQKLFKMKEEFPFVDANDNPVFRIEAGGILDFAGDYTLIDEGTDEPIAILEKEFTFFKHVWRIRDPHDDRLLATITSGSLLVEVLRNVISLASLIPQTYTIDGPSGEPFGTIEGRFSLKDTYDITIDETGDAPREALVAAAIAIDALEGN